MLKIAIGAVGAGKTETALRLITDTAREKRFARTWVLLATRRQEADFRQRLIDHEDGQNYYFNIEFFNFYDLYQRLLNLSQFPVWRVSAASRFGLLRAVIHKLNADGQLELYNGVAHTPGFVRVIASLIDELKQNRVDPQFYAGMARSRKDTELAAIYSHYQERLIGNGLADRDGEGWVALDLVAENNELARDVDLLVVDGYDQFTLVQSELLLRLSERVDETFITLPTAPGRETTLGRRFYKTLERLLDGTVEGTVTVEKIEAQGAYAASHPHLTHLCETLMLPYAQRLAVTGQIDGEKRSGVFMIEAPDAAAEVAAALRSVKRLLLNGVSPDQIMIALRDWERYQPQFVSLGRAYRIPLVLHYGDRLADVPIISTLLKLLQLHDDDFPRRALLDVLRAPYLRIPELDAEQIGLIERIAQQQIILKGRENWIDGIRRAGRVTDTSMTSNSSDDEIDLLEMDLIEIDRDEDGAAPAGLLTAAEAQRLALNLETFFEHVTPPEQATLEYYIVWLEGLIGSDPSDVPDDDEGDPGRVEEGYHFAMIECARDADAADERIAARDLTALQMLKQTFRSLLEARQLLLNLSEIQTRTLTWDDFYTQLTAAIEAADINPQPSRSGRVLVTTAINGRGLPHQHVLILGLSEGLFPKPAPQDPFYLDSERRSLTADDILLATSAERANDDGVFYELVAAPTQSLTLTRPTAQDGQPWAESHLWRAVLDAFDGLPVQRLRAGEVVPAHEAASLSEVALATADALNGGRAEDGTAAGHYQWLWQNQGVYWARIQHNREVEARRMAEDAAYDPHSGQLQDPAIIADIAAQLTSSRKWSASQWNEYGICPYRFFAARLLKLEKLKPPEEGMDVLQRGTLYHAILQETYQAVIDRQLTIAPEHQLTALEFLKDIAERICRAAPQQYGFRPTALWAQEQRTLVRRLERLVAKDFSADHPLAKAFPESERRPYRVEAAFGFASSEADAAPPLWVEIDLGEAGKVRLRGYIDRIDLIGDELYVIDYKSGSTPFRMEEMREGRSFQMVIYLLAAQALLDRTARVQGTQGTYGRPRAVAGGAFWHLPDNRLSGELLLPKHADVIQSALEKIRGYLPAMRSGRFVVEPGGSSDLCTPYCDFYDLCRLCKLGVAKSV